MACGGCRKNANNRHNAGSSDLSRYAYLSPRQLKLLKAKQEAEKALQQPPTPVEEE